MAVGLTACGPADVVVDADGQAAPGNCNATDPAPTTIQAGVDAASSGQRIQVCPGTYNDDVNINKSVILEGAKADVDARNPRGPLSQESVVGGSSAIAKFTVSADDVTINGFDFESVSGPALYTQPTVAGTDVRNNIFRGNTFGLYLNGNGDAKQLIVQRNLFDDNNNTGPASGNGIYSDQGLATATITANKFTSNQNAGILFAQSSGGPFVENVVVRNNSGDDNASFIAIFGDGATNIDVRSNTVTDTNSSNNGDQGSQIFVGDAGTGSPNGITIRSNTLSNAPFDGIAVRNSSYNIDVQSNTVTGAGRDGISVTSDHRGAGSVLSGNTVSSSADNGLFFGADSKGTFVETNDARSNTGVDCQDDSTGRQRVNVANIWATDNLGNESTPSGLCHS
jgi:parallel beta-helix repeat protein